MVRHIDLEQFQPGNEKSHHVQAPTSTVAIQRPSKLERVTEVLLAEFPTQKAIDKISAAGNGWWLIRNFFLPPRTTEPRVLGFESLASIVKLHPARIAKALINLVIGLHYLPSTSDCGVFELPRPIDAYISNCVNLVSTMLSDDEICGCNNGVEGLFALGIYYSCAGKPRSALLAYRRAIYIAQLLGIHRHSVRESRASEEVTAHFMQQLWYSLLGAERHLSLLLGLPYSVPTEHCDLQIEEDKAQLVSPDILYSRRAISIVSRLIDQNLSGKPPVLAATQEMDAELDAIAKSLPDLWWEPPPAIGADKTAENSQALSRALTHIYHFQLVALLHLPYMLRADSDRRYEYSRFACLNASREILIRYRTIWKADRVSFSKVFDFHVFTAAITILLSLLRLAQLGQSQTESDRKNWQLVDDLAGNMESSEEGDDGLVSAKAAKVIRALQEICLHPERNHGNTRLNIPYFGTVDISVNSGMRTQDAGKPPMPLDGQENIEAQGDQFSIQNSGFGDAQDSSWTSFPLNDLPSSSIWGNGPEYTQWGLENAPLGDYFHQDWNQS